MKNTVTVTAKSCCSVYPNVTKSLFDTVNKCWHAGDIDWLWLQNVCSSNHRITPHMSINIVATSK